jgi:cation diffusion facilitator family transporter
MSNCGCNCSIEMKNQMERRTLWTLLTINAVMFFVELIVGLVAESTGLVADSLDMFADATVYGIALYAVGKALMKKIHAAMVSGIFQVALAGMVVADVVRRFIYGGEPISALMIGIGLLALVANITCLALIAKHRTGEVHMRASWIFSTNDVLANLGVIGAGLAVHFMGTHVPDLIVGAIIASLVFFGGMRIIRDARLTHSEAQQTSAFK